MSLEIDRTEFDEWVKEQAWDRIWAYIDWMREQIVVGQCLRCGHSVQEFVDGVCPNCGYDMKATP